MQKEMSLKKRKVDEDRFSRLPDVLLHYILSFAETIYAVRTCVLSKRWKYVWKSVPNLDFICDSPSAALKHLHSTNFVDQVLYRLDSSNLHTFSLRSSPGAGVKLIPDVLKSYICYAIRHNVQVLILNFFGSFMLPLDLPPCFFNSKSLQVLKLDSIITLPHFFGLEALKTLQLVRCIIRRRRFDDIFSRLPNLETLILTRVIFDYSSALKISALKLKHLEISHRCACRDVFAYEVYAPRFTSFKYDGCAHVMFSMANCPSLDQLYVCFHKKFINPSWSKNEYAMRLVKIFQKLPNSKSVILPFETAEALSMEDPSTLLEDHPSPFSNLKYLMLEVDEKRYRKDITIPTNVLFYLLKNSPSAKTTLIQVRP